MYIKYFHSDGYQRGDTIDAIIRFYFAIQRLILLEIRTGHAENLGYCQSFFFLPIH